MRIFMSRVIFVKVNDPAPAGKYLSICGTINIIHKKKNFEMCVNVQ